MLKEIYLHISCIMMSFLVFIIGQCWSQEAQGRIPTSSIFWKSLHRVGIISLLNIY